MDKLLPPPALFAITIMQVMPPRYWLLRVLQPTVLFPITVIVLVLGIVAINAWRKVRERQIQSQADLRVREMEHQRKMKELEIELEKARARGSAGQAA